MLQVATAVRMYPKSLDRSQDVFEFKGKVLDIINGMRQHIHSQVVAEAVPGEEKTFLLLAGYSWRRSEFAIWKLHFDQSIDGFTFRPATTWRGIDGSRLLAVAGDAVEEFRERLSHLLTQRGKREAGGFDMEPFEVVAGHYSGTTRPCHRWTTADRQDLSAYERHAFCRLLARRRIAENDTPWAHIARLRTARIGST